MGLKDDHELSQRAQVSDNLLNLLRRKFSRKSRHLAPLSVANARGDLLVSPIQVMQVRAFVAARVRAMAMSAIFQEQLLAGGNEGRSVGCGKLWSPTFRRSCTGNSRDSKRGWRGGIGAFCGQQHLPTRIAGTD